MLRPQQVGHRKRRRKHRITQSHAVNRHAYQSDREQQRSDRNQRDPGGATKLTRQPRCERLCDVEQIAEHRHRHRGRQRQERLAIHAPSPHHQRPSNQKPRGRTKANRDCNHARTNRQPQDRSAQRVRRNIRVRVWKAHINTRHNQPDKPHHRDIRHTPDGRKRSNAPGNAAVGIDQHERADPGSRNQPPDPARRRLSRLGNHRHKLAHAEEPNQHHRPKCAK